MAVTEKILSSSTDLILAAEDPLLSQFRERVGLALGTDPEGLGTLVRLYRVRDRLPALTEAWALVFEEPNTGTVHMAAWVPPGEFVLNKAQEIFVKLLNAPGSAFPDGDPANTVKALRVLEQLLGDHNRVDEVMFLRLNDEQQWSLSTRRLTPARLPEVEVKVRAAAPVPRQIASHTPSSFGRDLGKLPPEPVRRAVPVVRVPESPASLPVSSDVADSSVVEAGAAVQECSVATAEVPDSGLGAPVQEGLAFEPSDVGGPQETPRSPPAPGDLTGQESDEIPMKDINTPKVSSAGNAVSATNEEPVRRKRGRPRKVPVLATGEQDLAAPFPAGSNSRGAKALESTVVPPGANEPSPSRSPALLQAEAPRPRRGRPPKVRVAPPNEALEATGSKDDKKATGLAKIPSSHADDPSGSIFIHWAERFLGNGSTLQWSEEKEKTGTAYVDVLQHKKHPGVVVLVQALKAGVLEGSAFFVQVKGIGILREELAKDIQDYVSLRGTAGSVAAMAGSRLKRPKISTAISALRSALATLYVERGATQEFSPQETQNPVRTGPRAGAVKGRPKVRTQRPRTTAMIKFEEPIKIDPAVLKYYKDGGAPKLGAKPPAPLRGARSEKKGRKKRVIRHK